MGALILPESNAEFAEKLRFLQNAIGAVPSPFDSWLVQRGVKTLHLRMKQHGLNALAVAPTRAGTREYTWSGRGGLPGKTEESRRKYELAWSVLSSHARKFIGADEGDGPPIGGFPFSGMISFRIRGGLKEAETFLTSAKLAESLGGVESLAEHPALMTHGSIPPALRLVLVTTSFVSVLEWRSSKIWLMMFSRLFALPLDCDITSSCKIPCSSSSNFQ